jgi:hypothetical protein
MRAIAKAALILLLAPPAAAACIDLFHSTADIRTACEIDSAATGCSEAGAALSLCAPTPAAALSRAQHVCAWLGACEGPFGRNAFGSCMFQALMAYDCDANPNHRFKGKAAGRWTCLAGAKSCNDIDGCVFPSGPQPCVADAAGVTRCGTGRSSSADNLDVRILCEPSFPPYHGENCALWGQTCTLEDGGAQCSGGAVEAGCAYTGCYGSTAIHSCRADGVDIGVDCTNFGTQRCSGFPSPQDVAWVSCIAETDAASSACTPDANASCVDGVAVSCPSGVLESLDCTRLLGVAGACDAGPLNPSFDWAGPCSVTPSQCSGDACNGWTLTGCERGAPFTVDCMQEGLGPCALASAEPGSPPRAACTPP